MIMLYQVVGLSNVQENIKSLKKIFGQAVHAIEDARPEFEKEFKQIKELEKELEYVVKKAERGEISAESLVNEKDRLERELVVLRSLVSNVQSTVRTVASKIDWKTLEVPFLNFKMENNC